MKKAKVLLITILTILLLYACGAKKNSEIVTEPNNQAASEISKEITADGKTITALSDGTIIEKSSDGTTKEIQVNGTVIETLNDGTITETKTDGTVVLTKADGTKIVTTVNELLNITEASTQAPPETLTQAPTETPTEASTEPHIETPTEAPTETPIETLTENSIIDKFGSYDAYKNALLDEVNKMRSNNGFGNLEFNTYANYTAIAESKINAETRIATGNIALSYPQLAGMYSGGSACANGKTVDFADTYTTVMSSLSYSATKSIINDGSNIYLGIGVTEYTSGGEDYVAIFFVSYNQEQYNNFVIGTKSWSQGLVINGKVIQETYTSRWAQ